MNTLTFEQIATILQGIQEQATGQKALAATNTADFVSAADTTLRTGYDPVFAAISQVLSRTIFSVRPYSRKFRGMEVTETQWGNHVRKINFGDNAIVQDDSYDYPVTNDATETPASGNGETVDQYTIRKADVVQTNFYGSSVFGDHLTVFRYQLDNAFKGPDELAGFVGGMMQNISDKLEQARENFARSVLANYMGGIIAENNAAIASAAKTPTGRVIHLLTEYNTATGLSLTASSVYQPANYKAFMQWVYARIAGLTAMMTERSNLFQTNLTGHNIMRHTPYQDQRVYLYAPVRYQTEMMALADTYHDNFLTMADNETVNFWQSIKTPDTINVTPTYIGAAGTPITPEAAVNQGKIFGVIFDREAAGYATTQEHLDVTPLNARGEYVNYWYHFTLKSWNDHTEKGVVLLLD